ncbi:MAG: VOC family protein [Defluviitaleaceae bacterium]|nr:VOC family protein [Defluviitaleaceae bacterium]
MVIKLSGFNIYAKDPVKAYEFYKGLGFVFGEVDDMPASGEAPGEYWCASFASGVTVWIWNDTNENDTPRHSRNELVIDCGGLDGMNALYEELLGKGYAISKPEKQFYGGWEMNLIDLDGNKILFLD